VPDDCETDCKPSTTLLLEQDPLPEALIADVTVDKCDCTKATFLVYVNLLEKPSRRFKIVSGTSASGTVLKTFEVYPLRTNDDNERVVSSGVFTKCGNLEMFKVGCLVRDASSTDQPPKFEGCLRLIVPLTKELKCLVPDFGFNNPVINETVNECLKVPVRLVSKGSCNLVYPACLSYNKKDCNVCLEIELGSDNLTVPRHVKTHNEKFGDLGCNAVCDPDFIFTPLDWKKLLLVRKLDVMGVDKCCETVLFSFQVCYEPLDRTYDNVEHQFCNDLKGSLRVQSEASEYCYEVLDKTSDE
jgi:hypothetical protein